MKQNNYSYESQLRKEVQLLNEQKISQTSYTQLFRATRSMQTEEESIPAEVDQAREDIETAMGKDVQMLISSFTTHLEKQTERMKIRYDEALQRILSAGRTNLANSIATVFKTEQARSSKIFDEALCVHRNEMEMIDNEIKTIKKKVLGIDSMLIKYRMFTEKAVILAKKSGIDLEGNSTAEISNLELLDSLQKNLDSKQLQCSTLQAKFASKPQNRKPIKSETTLEHGCLRLEKKLIQDAKKESTGNLAASFHELSSRKMDINDILTAMKIEFEKVKEEELQLTKDTLDDFQTQFENLRLQTKESKLNLSNEKYVNTAKKLFTRYKSTCTQCNIEDTY
ncbi:hypothetical protein HDV01_004075 [Terramyces sp. JEL0728]|nr:hypothetical protein HDV01_004075 [Terramyces sp. JEL0728]